MKEKTFGENTWALILGSSSGFGAATAIELARLGMNIYGVHFDRAATMPMAEKTLKEILACGVKAKFFNMNASDAAKRGEMLDGVKQDFASVPGSTVKVLMHSLAFGTLRPFISTKSDEMLTQAQLEMTLDVMSNSLVYWAQGLFSRGLITRGGRIFAMTSSGGRAVLPNYGAVSAAKCALQSNVRQLAMELGPHGITANSILAGVTDTAALKKIPGSRSMLDVARSKNPQLRTTTPEDVASAIGLLSQDASYFISGNVIGVDAGEDVVEYIGQTSPTSLPT